VAELADAQDLGFRAPRLLRLTHLCSSKYADYLAAGLAMSPSCSFLLTFTHRWVIDKLKPGPHTICCYTSPMKATSLLVAILFASTCFAQSKTTAPPLKSMKAQLAQAQADLQASELARVELESKNKVLESKSKELETSNAELNQKMDEIRKAASELLKADAIVYPAANKLQSDYGALVQRYNSLLDVAQNLDAQLRAANSRQQRFNNALALYNSMPKYTPPQQIQITNCNALPALCIH